MSLTVFLEQSRPTLTSRWVEAANAVYPFATTGFLRTKQNAFANPVGQRSRDLSEHLLNATVGFPHDSSALRAALEEFVRVRAVQDMPVETSLSVMFAYKNIIRNYIAERNITLTGDDKALLHASDERCDTLTLLAFGMYARSREALFNARLEDMRRRHSQILRLAQRHNLASEADGDASDETENTAS